jgi:hypothetical protein
MSSVIPCSEFARPRPQDPGDARPNSCAWYARRLALRATDSADCVFSPHIPSGSCVVCEAKKWLVGRTHNKIRNCGRCDLEGDPRKIRELVARSRWSLIDDSTSPRGTPCDPDAAQCLPWKPSSPVGRESGPFARMQIRREHLDGNKTRPALKPLEGS